MLPFSLLRKELRLQRPIFVLGLVLVGLSLLESLTGPMGPHSLAAPDLVGEGDAVLLLIISVVLGVQLSARERDAGTLRFLDGLPIIRMQMFGSMVLAAFAAVALVPLLDLSTRVAMHLIDPHSLGGEVHPLLMGELLASQWLLILVGLGVGAMVGLTGSLTWLTLAVTAALYVVMAKRIPAVSMMNPVVSLVPSPMGTRLGIDAVAVAVQASLAAVSLGIAAYGFHRAGRALPVLPLAVRRPVLGTIVVLLTIGVAVFVAANLRSTAGDDGSDDGDDAVVGVSFGNSVPTSRKTTHYRFSFPGDSSAKATELIDDADRIFSQVGVRLSLDANDPDLVEPVEVDMSGSRRNTRGTASLDRIRMKLGNDAPYVLAHETTHVVSRRIAGGSNDVHWAVSSTLNEGLAEWVGHAVAPQPDWAEDRADDLLILATLQHRRLLDVAAFTEISGVRKELDEDLQYPMGELMIEAVAKRYGKESVETLVRAFGTRTLPTAATGRTLWQAVFQIAGMDVSLIFSDVVARLDDEAEKRSAEVDGLPRPRAVLVTGEDGRVGVKLSAARGELPDGWRLTVRFRPRTDSDADEYSTETIEPGEIVWRDAANVSGGQVCLQPGLMAPSRHALFERWKCLQRADAEPAKE